MNEDEKPVGSGPDSADNWAWKPRPPSEVRRVDPSELPPEEVARIMAAASSRAPRGPGTRPRR